MKPIENVDLVGVFEAALEEDAGKKQTMVHQRCLHLLAEHRNLEHKVECLGHDLAKAKSQLQVSEGKLEKAEGGDWSVLPEHPPAAGTSESPKK